MHELATFHIEGDGVEVDPEKVKHWMFKAAALGQSDAIDWVNENYPDQPSWLKDLKKEAQDISSNETVVPLKSSDDGATKPKTKTQDDSE